ncbi:unnamed protein product [Rhizoctonia solani]|uniref:Uncharacterized protein n=1 Tax=Rhizoctonia solani TaxID=456999 RepID=A0A8H3BBP5_9AGAM|nr:unnamed protein product [Rhizoctonia solani]
MDTKLATGNYDSDIIQRISHIQTDIDLLAGTIAKVTVVTDLTVLFESLVDKINICAEVVLAIGGNTGINPSTKTDVATKITAIITVLGNLSIELVAKFGAGLVLHLRANIDICLLILLSSVNIYANGASPHAQPTPDM